MSNPEVWHRSVISASTEETLCVLQEASLLEDFYLAGGTALALWWGHRVSLDLDFFCNEHFNEDALLQRAQSLPGFALVQKAPFTVHATIAETKVSFLGYAYPMLFETATFAGVAVADPRDIACMKVSAIASRGAKRDFVDLYFAARHYGLKEILRQFDRKYAQTRLSRLHILKSLTYFSDAEKEPMPHLLETTSWDKVKQFFEQESLKLL